MKSITLFRIISLPVLLCFSGCRSRIEYRTIETIVEKHDTLYRGGFRQREDSTIILSKTLTERHDSTAVILDSLKRVIGIERWHFEKVSETSAANRGSRDSQKDTLIKASSIQTLKEVPVEIVKRIEVPRKRTRAETILLAIGIASLLYILLRLFSRIKSRS